jgi:FMN-dependent NADH-azoreductase
LIKWNEHEAQPDCRGGQARQSGRLHCRHEVADRQGKRQYIPQESYLKTVFNFVGITDIRFVRAEGLGMGPQGKANALAAAEVNIRALTGQSANDPKAAVVA